MPFLHWFCKCLILQLSGVSCRVLKGQQSRVSNTTVSLASWFFLLFIQICKHIFNVTSDEGELLKWPPLLGELELQPDALLDLHLTSSEQWRWQVAVTTGTGEVPSSSKGKKGRTIKPWFHPDLKKYTCCCSSVIFNSIWYIQQNTWLQSENIDSPCTLKSRFTSLSFNTLVKPFNF